MEGVVDPAWWHGRSVLVTGHTGFKGAWLCQWLLDLGARVHGFALPPESGALFEVLGHEQQVPGTLADLSDAAALGECIAQTNPGVIFHLAAQSLVRRGYQDPAATFASNVQGTVNLLDAIRHQGGARQVIIVTSDKCYRNDETVGHAFVEDDPLGGKDPYSASKAAQEIVAASYRESYFRDTDINLATVRAGNVIGGGDVAADRLLPDLIRAWQAGRPLVIRNPDAIRPWQHVLEPLSAYLGLAERMPGGAHNRAYNIGPPAEDCWSVQAVLEAAHRTLPDFTWELADDAGPAEAQLLRLDAGLARAELGWQPRLPTSEAISRTIDWYLRAHQGDNMQDFTREQIRDYCQ